ncbi:MAG: glycosyltransferase involved in cell wall biosynthesis [Oceanospirillaceae bacterium]|jgi:glycosyltransferase involved in cell wall biosynthesis
MRILIIGTLTGTVCGELLCNLRVTKLLKVCDNINHVYTISSTVDHEFTSPGIFSIKKFYSSLKIIFLSYMHIFKKIDVVYLTPGLTVFGLMRFVPIIFFYKLFNKRVICHFHGSRLKKTLSNPFFGCIFIYALSVCNKLIFLSEHLSADVSEFFPEKKCIVIPNSLESQWYKPFVKGAVSSKLRKVLFLSNFLSEKGIFQSLEAMLLLYQDGQSFEFYIAGNGSKENVEKVNAYIDKCPSLKMIGPIYGSDKIDLYRDSDIFLFPTIYKQEAFPLVILEALSSKCVVVSCSTGAIPEILNDGISGVLLKDNNVATIYEAIKTLFDNDEMMSTLSNNGFARSLEYKADSIEETLLNVILNES